MIKKLLPLLVLILIGCSEPEPKDINILNLDDNYYYYLDTKYSGVYSDKNNSDFYYMGQMSKGKYHGYFKKFDYEDNLISETQFVNGFNVGPIIFYTENGISSILEGEFEMIESRNSKIKYDKDKDWDVVGDDQILDPLSSDYLYKIKIDYLKKKITNSIKISESEENLYYGFYEPNIWIEDTYSHFSINDFNIVGENETLSELYVNYLVGSDLKDFEEDKLSTIDYLKKRKKEYIDEDISSLVEFYEERITDTLSETFDENYRKENNTLGYQIQNGNYDKIIYEIQLLDKDKFLFIVKIFRNGYQNYEVEQIWTKFQKN